MFRGVFSQLVGLCINMIQDKELDDQARQNALELMATFADNNPAMCKKDPEFHKRHGHAMSCSDDGRGSR